MDFPQRFDLHMHTCVSDGTDTPEEIIDCVRAAGITCFSVTDHDAIKGCEIIRGILKDDDLHFVCGTELSCRDEEGQYHILGYRYDPLSEPINALIEKGHSLRMKKVTARLDFIRTEFGFEFPKEEIDHLLSLDNPGKPHIGNLMVKYGYADTKEIAICEYINKLRMKKEYIRPEEAITAILQSDGIPILAHPCYGSGDQLILGEEMENRLIKLMGFGLKGIEAFYSGFSEKLRNQMLALAEKYDLYVTAGSDYHGKNKLVRLGDTGLDPAAEIPEGLRRFAQDAFEK
ncbi:MAG: PHP domain-containing protein [Ruminococcus sp.]|nr:PHP domain-containing protein [Ruminococcus sp.]MBR0303221.1 PHP domain-containing protein [Clostridia bacterium]